MYQNESKHWEEGFSSAGRKSDADILLCEPHFEKERGRAGAPPPFSKQLLAERQGHGPYVVGFSDLLNDVIRISHTHNEPFTH